MFMKRVGGGSGGGDGGLYWASDEKNHNTTILIAMFVNILSAKRRAFSFGLNVFKGNTWLPTLPSTRNAKTSYNLLSC